MRNLIWLALIVGLMGCASAPKTPPGGPEDTLVFFFLDTNALKGDLDRVYFQDTKSQNYINATYDRELKTGFLFLKPGTSYYLEELKTLSGAFSGPTIHRTFAVQNSPMKIKGSSKRDLRYAGAFMYHEEQESWISVPKFSVQDCGMCSSEQAQLKRLLQMAEKHKNLLTPEWLALIQKRIGGSGI